MIHLLAIDGPVYRVLAGWTALVRATAVWLMCSLPIVTAPAAIVVLLRSVHEITVGNGPLTVRDSWRLVRRSFWAGVRLAGMVGAGTIVVAAAVLGPSPGGRWDAVLPTVAVPIATMWFLVAMWAFAVVDERADGAWNALRYAYLRAVRRPDLAVVSAVGATAVIALGVVVPPAVSVLYWLTAPATCAVIVTSTCRRAGIAARRAQSVSTQGGQL